MSGRGPVVVTGGAGYLGSVMTRRLLAAGRPVTVIDDLTFGDHGLASVRHDPGLQVVPVDVRDVPVLRAVLTGAEAVVHLAAVANDPSGDLDRALTRSINFDVYAPLLEACREAGVRTFVNASSFSVYGIAVRPNITEDDPLNCLREYSRCKADAEPLVRSYDSPSMTTVNLRLATLCGWSPRMRFDLVANLLLGEALRYRRITVVGGEQCRPQVHLHDVCDLVELLLDAPRDRIGGEVFNVGGENTSILELATTARDVVQADGRGPVTLTHEPARDDERSYVVSSEKLARTLGFRATRTVARAMADVAAAYERGEWHDHRSPEHHNVRHLLGVLAAQRARAVV
ncbi:SDR family oxidoreductase [Pseudonocardia sp. C8]|uniref:NAD-dependent epimerase/dehydratase family protein n=1 Tax=Pseudonocardia sp. C8 TaxID=2762759 RepID=UPI0016432504|nr:SDR family oxidoreductase [Pseudonocardia sp. C8]MBC3193496.1 SDR family oxidoreductase [Pseudonocardia sp. C8]